MARKRNPVFWVTAKLFGGDERTGHRAVMEWKLDEDHKGGRWHWFVHDLNAKTLETGTAESEKAARTACRRVFDRLAREKEQASSTSSAGCC